MRPGFLWPESTAAAVGTPVRFAARRTRADPDYPSAYSHLMIRLRPLLALTLAIGPLLAQTAAPTAPAAATAAAPSAAHSPEKLRVAEAFLAANGAKQTHEASYSMMEDAYAAGADKMPAEQQARMRRMGARITELMKQELSWDTVKADYIRAAADSYTEEEMQAAIAFYKTPAGASFAGKQAAYGKAGMRIGMSRMQALQPKMTAIMMEEMNPGAAGEKPAGENAGTASKLSATSLRLREKMLINDARQLASAANQFFSEQARTEATVGDIRKAGFITRLSGGVKIAAFDRAKPTEATPLDYASGAADAIVLKAGGHFALTHEALAPADVKTGKLADNLGAPARAFVFEVDTANPVKQ